MARRNHTVIGLVTGAIALSAVLTGLAFALSYAHLHTIAGDNGLPSMWRSWMWPATVDLFIVIGDVLTVAALLAGKSPARGLIVTSFGSLASIGINVAGVGAHRPAMEYVIAAVPPVAAQVAFAVIMWQLHDILLPAAHPGPVNTPASEPNEQVEQENEPAVQAPTQPPTQPLPTLLTTRQVADRFGMTPNAVNNWVTRGKLTPVKVVNGQGRLFDPSHVDALEAART
jgi:hypothetical protein